MPFALALKKSGDGAEDGDVGESVARGRGPTASWVFASSERVLTYTRDGLPPVAFPVGKGPGYVSRIVAVTRSAYLVASRSRRELDQVMDLELRDSDNTTMLAIPAGSGWTDQPPEGNALSRTLWPKQTDKARLVPVWSRAEVEGVARAAGLDVDVERGPSLGAVMSLDDPTTTGSAQGMGGQGLLILLGALVLFAIAVAIVLSISR